MPSDFFLVLAIGTMLGGTCLQDDSGDVAAAEIALGRYVKD
jgi:hypothetical protein